MGSRGLELVGCCWGAAGALLSRCLGAAGALLGVSRGTPRCPPYPRGYPPATLPATLGGTPTLTEQIVRKTSIAGSEIEEQLCSGNLAEFGLRNFRSPTRFLYLEGPNLPNIIRKQYGIQFQPYRRGPPAEDLAGPNGPLGDVHLRTT